MKKVKKKQKNTLYRKITEKNTACGFSCAETEYFSAHEKPTGNNCAGIKVNSAQLKIIV